ncbi:MAG: hypothetical protein ACFFG0_04190 [Candidatus Thorarchaeota archaeon]
MPNKEDVLHLHFNDLKLLMDNYQNVVQLNTLLLEQQKQILDLQKELVKNQSNVTNNQLKINDKIENMIKKVEAETFSFHQQVKELDSALHNRFNSSEESMHGRFDSTDGRIDNTKQSIDNVNLDMVKQHSGLSMKMYVGYVGTILIILALIGLVTTSIEKFSLLTHIHKIVENIATFLKIS